MKTRKELAPEKALRLLFLLFTLAFFCAALLMPDRSYMFRGFLNLLRLPAKTPTNYFPPATAALQAPSSIWAVCA